MIRNQGMGQRSNFEQVTMTQNQDLGAPGLFVGGRIRPQAVNSLSISPFIRLSPAPLPPSSLLSVSALAY